MNQECNSKTLCSWSTLTVCILKQIATSWVRWSSAFVTAQWLVHWHAVLLKRSILSTQYKIY